MPVFFYDACKSYFVFSIAYFLCSIFPLHNCTVLRFYTYRKQQNKKEKNNPAGRKTHTIKFIKKPDFKYRGIKLKLIYDYDRGSIFMENGTSLGGKHFLSLQTM